MKSLVHRHFPGASDEGVDALLFECTAFPFASLKAIEEQLQDLAHKANSVDDALYLAHGEFVREWEEHKRSLRPTPQDHKYGEAAQAAAERLGYERFDYCERS